MFSGKALLRGRKTVTKAIPTWTHQWKKRHAYLLRQMKDGMFPCAKVGQRLVCSICDNWVLGGVEQKQIKNNITNTRSGGSNPSPLTPTFHRH